MGSDLSQMGVLGSNIEQTNRESFEYRTDEQGISNDEVGDPDRGDNIEQMNKEY